MKRREGLALDDLLAVLREQMTDAELNAAQLISDRALYGFSAIDAQGNRVDPRDIKPAP